MRGIVEHLVDPRRRIIVYWDRILCAFLSAVSIGYLLAHVPQALEHYWSRAGLREASRRAGRAELSYEEVLAEPSAAAGQTVRWFLTHPTKMHWYYHGDPNRPVRWAAEIPNLIDTGQSGSSHGDTVVAAVVSADSTAVTLSYIGKD